jgi:hypothetical protein
LVRIDDFTFFLVQKCFATILKLTLNFALDGGAQGRLESLSAASAGCHPARVRHLEEMELVVPLAVVVLDKAQKAGVKLA